MRARTVSPSRAVRGKYVFYCLFAYIARISLACNREVLVLETGQLSNARLEHFHFRRVAFEEREETVLRAGGAWEGSSFIIRSFGTFDAAKT